MERVLVITSSLPQAEDFHDRLLSGKYPDLAFRYPSHLSRDTLDLPTLVARCAETVKEEDIDVVLSLLPEFTLIHSVLSKEFPHLKGPSTESVFLCLNRTYMKEKVLHGFNLEYTLHEIRELDRAMLQSELEHLGSPLVLKDGFALDNSVERKIKSLKHASKEIETVKTSVETSLQLIQPLLEPSISLDKYPQAFIPTWVAEEHTTHNKSSATLHYVEACVKDGMIIPWVISDLSFFRHRPHYSIQCTSVPTALDENDIIQIWAVFREAVQTLITAGLDLQFVHAKIAVSRRGSIKIVDLFPCILAQNTQLYKYVFHDGDNLQAQVSLGLDGEAWTPKPRPEKAAMRANVLTHHKGLPLADLVDLKAAKAESRITITALEEEVSENRMKPDGTQLMTIDVFEPSKAACMRRVREVCAAVLTMIPSDAMDNCLPPVRKKSLASVLVPQSMSPRLGSPRLSRGPSPVVKEGTQETSTPDKSSDESTFRESAASGSSNENGVSDGARITPASGHLSLEASDGHFSSALSCNSSSLSPSTNLLSEGMKSVSPGQSSKGLVPSMHIPQTGTPHYLSSSTEEIHEVNCAFSHDTPSGSHNHHLNVPGSDLLGRGTNLSPSRNHLSELSGLPKHSLPGLDPEKMRDKTYTRKSGRTRDRSHPSDKEDLSVSPSATSPTRASSGRSTLIPKGMIPSSQATLPNIARVKAETQTIRSSSFSGAQNMLTGATRFRAKRHSVFSDSSGGIPEGASSNRRMSTPGMPSKKPVLSKHNVATPEAYSKSVN